MLNILKKAILLFVILLSIPTPAYAKETSTYVIIYTSCFFLFGIIAGILTAAYHISRKKILGVSCIVILIGIIWLSISAVDSIIRVDWSANRFLYYLLLFLSIIGASLFSFTPFILGFLLAGYLVNYFRKRPKNTEEA